MLSEKGKVAIIEKYISREQNHNMYKREMRFYSLVKLGRKNEVAKALESSNFRDNINKPLSDNTLQSLKYHLTITGAMLARFCIEGGMDINRAYELSDIYIMRADSATNENQLFELHKEMCMSYVKDMEKLRKENIYSKPVVMSIDYIYSNLHRRITLTEIANEVRLNESYFSKLFRTETGIPVSSYIMQKKIETAQNLLVHSDYSFLEISELLAFSSQSHFISCFRKECGMTPRDYRNRFFKRLEVGHDEQ